MEPPKLKPLVIMLVCAASILSLAARVSPQRTLRRAPKTKPPVSQKVQEPRDYVLHLKLDAEARLQMSVGSTIGDPFLGPSDLVAFIKDLSEPRSTKASLTPRVMLDAEPETDLLMVFNVLSILPVTDASRVFVVIPDGPELRVPPAPSETPEVDVKPNPLTLVVKIGEGDTLTLNNESQGSLRDTSKLSTRLRRILKEREENGVFREGSNDIEKTVSIVLPLNGRKFGDLAKIARAVQLAGSDVIDLYPYLGDTDIKRKPLIDLDH